MTVVAPDTVPPVCCAICRMRVESSGSTRVKSAAVYGLSSGKAATWTSACPCDAVNLPFARATVQPAGASKRKPEPLRDCGGCCAAPEPPQPATMAAETSSAAHATRRSEATRKDWLGMANTKDKVYDAAENVKPYVERAMSDEKLKQDVLSAFATAKELYSELVGSRSAVTLASPSRRMTTYATS